MMDPWKHQDWEELEPECYEIRPGPDGDLTRRDLWKLLGTGVLLVFADRIRAAPAGELLSTRFHIGENGVFTLLTGKVEIGQGARTELTQVVAEELGVNVSRVRVMMADTDAVPDDGGTYASLTTPQTVPVVRRAAARARQLLPSLKTGEQLPGAVPAETEVVDPADWKVCGTPIPRVGAIDLVTGKHHFAGDMKAPGMLYGKVKRAPAYYAELTSVDDAGARKIPGVQVVREGNFIGAVAPDQQRAATAVERITAEWKATPLIPADELPKRFKTNAQEPVFREGTRYPALLQMGSLEEGMARADAKLESSYTVAHIAHAPMEPRAALAEWEDGRLTVKTCTQVPFGVRRELARTFSIPEERVRVIGPDVGGGFGGKHRSECAEEAARLAKAAGKPVMVSWSRKEEFTCSYCRPAGVVEVRSGVTKGGKVVAWDFHNYNSGPAGITPPYEFPNHYCGYHRSESQLRQGPYRSLAAAANAFAREMHMEEIANRIGMDAVEFRLKNLENPRMREVVERAAEAFGWGKTKNGNGRGFGMACNLEKGGHLASFVELEAAAESVRIHRMVTAFDCGAVINPDNLRNQITGAMLQGIGGAVFEELRWDREQILNPRFSDYRVPRFSDLPKIEVILVDRREETSAGAGESPITGVAPAIGAAIHNATGRWRRSLPMFRSDAANPV